MLNVGLDLGIISPTLFTMMVLSAGDDNGDDAAARRGSGDYFGSCSRAAGTTLSASIIELGL